MKKAGGQRPPGPCRSAPLGLALRALWRDAKGERGHAHARPHFEFEIKNSAPSQAPHDRSKSKFFATFHAIACRDELPPNPLIELGILRLPEVAVCAGFDPRRVVIVALAQPAGAVCSGVPPFNEDSRSGSWRLLVA